MSVRRELPARAASIALATAYQESKIQNLDYGDRDSLGIFQQRPSQGWGKPEQIMDPHYSTNRFYAALEQVDGYDELPIDEAAQEVQRSADGSAYAQHEPDARALASALTGYSEAAFSCEVDEPADSGQQPGPSGLTAQRQRRARARCGRRSARCPTAATRPRASAPGTWTARRTTTGRRWTSSSGPPTPPTAGPAGPWRSSSSPTPTGSRSRR